MHTDTGARATGSSPRRRSRSVVAAALLISLSPFGALPAAAAPNDPHFGRQWALAKIGAEQAWTAGRGAGVTIAIVDTGVHLTHEDLAAGGKVVPGIDYIAAGTSPQDEHGHGTHVAGIATAATGNGRGIAGVAPDARIMPVRVLDENGGCVGSCRVADAIRWAADHGAGVINLSLGEVGQQVFGPSFGSALLYAWSSGSIPVVAAGNDFLLSSGYADHPALVVAATDRHDGKPDFSSGVGGAKWGISAPGGGSSLDEPEDHVLSAHFDSAAPSENGSYAYRRGTSQAAPHVAGAAAVLLSLGLDAQETVDRLLQTAKDLGPPGRDATFGHGRLDLARAVEGLGVQAPTQGSGQQPTGAASHPAQGGDGPQSQVSGGPSSASGTAGGGATSVAGAVGRGADPTGVRATDSGTRRPGTTSSPDDATTPFPVVVDLPRSSEPADDAARTTRGWASPLGVVLVLLAFVLLLVRRRAH